MVGMMQDMVPIEDLLSKVMRHAPSCPEPTAVDALREAAITYSRALPVWHDVDSFEVSSPGYEVLFTHSEARIVSIVGAQLAGQDLTPITLVDLTRKQPNWPLDDVESSPRYLVQTNENSFTLYPKARGLFSAVYRLRPSDTALTLPRSLVADHGEFIAQGALGALLAMASTEWANAGLASFFLNKFAERTDTGAQLRALSGQIKAPVRTKGNFF